MHPWTKMSIRKSACWIQMPISVLKVNELKKGNQLYVSVLQRSWYRWEYIQAGGNISLIICYSEYHSNSREEIHIKQSLN